MTAEPTWLPSTLKTTCLMPLASAAVALTVYALLLKFALFKSLLSTWLAVGAVTLTVGGVVSVPVLLLTVMLTAALVVTFPAAS